MKCLLFDLDGTLFDSSDANVAAYRQAFKAVGLPFSEAEYRRLFGLRFPEMMAKLAPKATAQTQAKIKEHKAKAYQANLAKVRPNQGLLALLQTLSKDYKTGLITTASRTNVDNLLQHFAITPSLFDVIIYGEDVGQGKPDPECYLAAMKRLKVKPADVIIFEDSEVGLAAARASGAEVIKVSL